MKWATAEAQKGGLTPARRWAMPSRYLRLPILVLAAGLLFSALTALQMSRLSHRVDTERFEHEVSQTHAALRERLEIYIAMLESGAGLMSSGQIDAQAFRRFVARLELERRYSGVQGIGWSVRVAPGQIAELASQGESTHGPQFRLWPEHGSERHAILFLEPLDQRNRAALGFDMHSEATRRAAMDQARDSGRTTASGGVQLVQEIDEHKQAGFLIYAPVYSGGETPATLAERRRLLAGFVYSPFRADDLLGPIFAETMPHGRVRFRVYDGAVRPDALLHSSEAAWEDENRFSQTRRLPVAGREWLVTYQARQPFYTASRSAVGALFLAGGLFASLALFLASLAQVRQRYAADLAVESARREIEARVKVESHQQLLIDELNHRVKNSLAAVQSIAAQTLRHTGSPVEFKEAFTNRLLAMSEAHNLLAQEHWRGAALADLVAAQLRPFGGERISMTGPPVRLNPAQAVALGMLLHELAANAAKYGALSRPEGRVDLTWEAVGRNLSLHWRESGGPPVVEPTRRGFGTRLIERGLAQELRGSAQLRFDPAGLACDIRVEIADPEPLISPRTA